MAATLMSGATLLLPYRMLAAQVLDLIRRERPTHTIGAMTAFNALLSLPDSAREDFASFERVISGGAPIPPPLRDRIEAELGLVLYPGYGMTETAAASHVSAFVSTIPVDAASGALTIGVPLPGTEAMVVDDHDQPVAPGEPGELLLRGRHIMSGYWNREEETAETLRGGWMHTGDIVVMDEAGWFYVVDRKKDVIIASGYKVWPREVEDPAELAAHCREHLAPYKVPRSFEIMDELPKTVTGKIQRNVLRQKASTAR
jgi:long-chain acyl-CoA synthetase